MKKFIVNPVTGDYESTSYTFGDRFGLKDGGRINFSKGGTQKLLAYLNNLSDGTNITRELVSKIIKEQEFDVNINNFFLKNSEQLKSGLNVIKRKSPLTVTDDVLKTFDDYVKNTNLSLEKIGKEAFGIGGDSNKGFTRNHPVVKEYLKKNEIPANRFGTKFLKDDPAYIKTVVNDYKKTGSIRETASNLGKERKTIRSVLEQFDPTFETGEAPLKKGTIAEGKTRGLKTRRASETIGSKKAGKVTFDQTKSLYKTIKETNEVIKDLPVEDIANNKAMINSARLMFKKTTGEVSFDGYTEKDPNVKLKKKPIYKTDMEMAKHIKSKPKNTFLHPEHISGLKNQNSMYPRSIQAASYMENAILDQFRDYVKKNGKSSPSIDRYLKSRGLKIRVDGKNYGSFSEPKKGGVIFNPKTNTSNIVNENIRTLGLNSTGGSGMKFLKGVVKKIPYLGGALGVSSVSEATEMGVENLVDLGVAYNVDALTALKNKIMREDTTGQAVAEEISNLPDISAEAALPMDETMMMAQGGRVNFAEGSPDPDFLKMTLAARENENIPFNPIKNFNEIINPKAFAGYAQKIAAGAIKLPEYAARFIPAGGALASDLIRGKKGGLENFGKNMQPKVAEALIEKMGLQKLIDESEAKATGSQKYYGDMLELGTELLGPATAIGYFTAAGKLTKSGIKELQKISGKNFPKIKTQMEEKISAAGESRRDFNKTVAVGGMIGLAKVLGLDSLLTTTAKVASKVPAKIITAGGTPKYFFDFVSLVKKLGDDVTDKAATLERQKVYDYKGYTLTEDISSGEIKIYKDTEGGGTYNTPDGQLETYDGTIFKEEISYKPKETILDDNGKPVKVDDIYEENTLKPDMDGDFEDVQDGLESIDDILDILAKDGKKYNLKELGEMGINPSGLGESGLRKILKDPTEINSLKGEDMFKDTINRVKYRSEKAGGGIMKLAGDDSGPPPTSGPNSQGLALILKRAKQY